LKALFLDANILLDFYRFGSDDLDQIEKLVTLIEEEEITLLSNEHLKNEVYKNRERVISDAIKTLGEKLKFRAPVICEGLDQTKEIKSKVREANALIAELQRELEASAKSRSLRADNLIKDLFAAAQVSAVTDQTIASAQQRILLGYPPGKQGSIGDAIHWVTLLASGRNFVSIVTRDGDFRSPLDGSSMAQFLTDEWKEKLSSWAEVQLFPSLSQFLSVNFPQIKLSEETTKNSLVDELFESRNFATTHAIIEPLSGFDFFTNKQVSRLFQVLVGNSQVSWIATDTDVRMFFLGLKDKAYLAPIEIHEEVANMLEVDESNFFIPF
jgi:predicted nucleic acid-binding protein